MIPGPACLYHSKYQLGREERSFFVSHHLKSEACNHKIVAIRVQGYCDVALT
jgi:hypothetical protein